MGKRKNCNTNQKSSNRPTKRRKIDVQNEPEEFVLNPATCPEIVANIIKYLTPIELYPASVVSKQWHATVKEQFPNLPICTSIGTLVSNETLEHLRELKMTDFQTIIVEETKSKHVCYLRVYSGSEVVFQKECDVHPSIRLLKDEYSTDGTVNALIHVRQDGQLIAYMVTAGMHKFSNALSTGRFTLYNMDTPNLIHHDWSNGVLASPSKLITVMGKYLMLFIATGVQVYDMELDSPHAFYTLSTDFKIRSVTVMNHNQVKIFISDEKDGQDAEFIWHLSNDAETGLLLDPKAAAKECKDFESFAVTCEVGFANTNRAQPSTCCWNAESSVLNDHLDCLRVCMPDNLTIRADLMKLASRLDLCDHLNEVLNAIQNDPPTQGRLQDVCLNAFKAAITHHSTNCIDILMNHPCIQAKKEHGIIAETAVRADNLSTLRVLRDNGFYIPMSICEATESGSINCLKYLIEELNQNIESHVLKHAAKHIECMKYLIEERKAQDDGSLMENVCKFGTVEVLEYLHKRGHQLTSRLIYWSAKLLQFDCLRYVVEHGCAWPTPAVVTDCENYDNNENSDDDSDSE